MTVDINKQLDRAKKHLERNKLEDAVEAYQSILDEMPGHFEALQAMGDIHTRLNQTDRAAIYYGMLFDRFFDAREENKALAIYTRALKGMQQPPERMARYALFLQRQNRGEEAIEQYALASELLLARGKEESALDCLDRVAQLDPENAGRQCAAGELAERLGRKAVAARAFLRAGQLSDAAGEAESALELLARAHRLVPSERGPALLYAEVLLRRDDAASAVQVLEPFSSGEQDAKFLSTFGEALMQCGALDRARGVLERLPAEQPATSVKLFDLVGRYLAANQEAQAVELLGKIQQMMVAARRESDFAAHLDALVEAHPDSMGLAEFWATAYAKLNRETKYFDALVRLFDMYLAAGNVPGACDSFEKLVDIDPYDSRNQERLEQLETRADAEFLTRIRARLARVATHTQDAPVETTQSIAPQAAGEQSSGQPSLEDLIVQAEIFAQYSLQSKAVERLQKIVQMFPGEAERNERLRNLCQLANWWPPGIKVDATQVSQLAEPAPVSAAVSASASADTMRDLAKISEISQSLFRLPSPRAILAAAVNATGNHLRATRCLAMIGAPGKPPQMASEFCSPGIEPASGALLVRLLGHLEHATPDSLGGLPLEASAAPVLRELGLETVLGVVLTDRETQTQAGMVVVGYAMPHAWRPNETYFLQAVGDQMLLGVSHSRLRTQVRTVGVADEKTGLLARSSYQDCLLGEAQRAKSQGTALALVLVQVDRGPELLRQHGEAQMERHLEQLARTFESVVRQTDLAVKYTSWTIAFVLPDTPLAGAETLTEKLRAAGAQVRPPWDGVALTLSASAAEAAARPEYDSEDIVTELINRGEAGLEEAHRRGGNALVAMKIPGS